MARLSEIPLLYQPGEAWLYDTCSDLQGVLIARVSGQPLPAFLAERVFEPLGMVDSGFELPAGKRDRLTSYYRPDPAGGLELADAPDGQWSRLPAFPAGSGGLVATVDDWYRFARMILGEGELDGRRLLSPGSVAQMTSNHLSRSQRDVGALRRLGRRRTYRCLERPRTLRMGRRHRNDGPRQPVDRIGRHPAHAGSRDRPRPARAHARLLALRSRLGAMSLASATGLLPRTQTIRTRAGGAA